MAVEFLVAPDPDVFAIADRHLYLTADFTTVVEEGDAASASQFVARGHAISQADADRLGLVVKDGRVEQHRNGTPDAPATSVAPSAEPVVTVPTKAVAKKPAAKRRK